MPNAAKIGSATKLNELAGFALTVPVSVQDETDHANVVFDDGMVLKTSTGKILFADGVKTLAQLLAAPAIDTAIAPLTATERGYITNAGAANGFIVADADNKLPVDYLSRYIDTTTGKVLLSALPDSARAGVTYVANITARDALANDSEAKRGVVFVVDASDDPTVDSGAAMYAWVDDPENAGQKKWQKYAEVEGLDQNIDDLVTEDLLENKGAVLYKHTVVLKSPTLSQIVTLKQASEC